MKQYDKIILTKMLDEIKVLEKSVGKLTEKEFLLDEDKKRATGMTLINIGELANHLSKEFIGATKEIPFRKIVDLRNVAAHGYFTIVFEDIWRLVQQDIPQLKIKLKEMLS